MIDRKKFLGSELIVAVLANFPVSAFKMADTADLIQALHSVKKKNAQYADYFQNYAFDEDGRYPDSRALSEALDSLQHTTLLRRENPYLVSYSISYSLKRYYNEVVRKKVKPAETAKLERFSRAVFDELNSHYVAA